MQRVRDLLSEEAAARALEGRFAIINVWRSINGTVTDTPLAFCDPRSIAVGDLVATDVKYPTRTGEVFHLAFSRVHRWLCVHQLQDAEVLLLKGFDSASDGRARFTPHTAFDDPASADAPPGTARRASIESRALVLF